MQKKQTTSVVAGLIISLFLVIISLVVYFADLFTETWAQYIGMVILFGGIIWAVINHGKERNHNVSFGNLFGFGFKTTAVIICVTIAYTLIFGYIFPDAKQKIIELSREKALAEPGANESQIEQGMEMFEKNYNLFIIIGIVFWYAAIGAVSSLIAAAVARKNPDANPTFDNV